MSVTAQYLSNQKATDVDQAAQSYVQVVTAAQLRSLDTSNIPPNKLFVVSTGDDVTHVSSTLYIPSNSIWRYGSISTDGVTKGWISASYSLINAINPLYSSSTLSTNSTSSANLLGTSDDLKEGYEGVLEGLTVYGHNYQIKLPKIEDSSDGKAKALVIK